MNERQLINDLYNKIVHVHANGLILVLEHIVTALNSQLPIDSNSFMKAIHSSAITFDTKDEEAVNSLTKRIAILTQKKPVAQTTSLINTKRNNKIAHFQTLSVTIKQNQKMSFKSSKYIPIEMQGSIFNSRNNELTIKGSPLDSVILDKILIDPKITIKMIKALANGSSSSQSRICQPYKLQMIAHSLGIKEVTLQKFNQIECYDYSCKGEDNMKRWDILNALQSAKIEELISINCGSSMSEPYALTMAAHTFLYLIKQNKVCKLFENYHKTLSTFYKISPNECSEFLLSLSGDEKISKECYEFFKSGYKSRVASNILDMIPIISNCSIEEDPFINPASFLQLIPLLYKIPLNYWQLADKSGVMVINNFKSDISPFVEQLFPAKIESECVIVNIGAKFYYGKLSNEPPSVVKYLCDCNIQDSYYMFVKNVLKANSDRVSKEVNEASEICCPQCKKKVQYSNHFVTPKKMITSINNAFNSVTQKPIRESIKYEIPQEIKKLKQALFPEKIISSPSILKSDYIKADIMKCNACKYALQTVHGGLLQEYQKMLSNSLPNRVLLPFISGNKVLCPKCREFVLAISQLKIVCSHCNKNETSGLLFFDVSTRLIYHKACILQLQPQIKSKYVCHICTRIFNDKCDVLNCTSYCNNNCNAHFCCLEYSEFKFSCTKSKSHKCNDINAKEFKEGIF